MLLALIMFLSFLPQSDDTASWQCTNPIEISCDSESCAAEDEGSFTPMSVSFDDSGKMSVCAYTGCWEGTGKVFNDGDFLVLSGQKLKFTTAPDNAAVTTNISITLDKSDNVGMLKAGSFAHPLICEQK